LAGRVFLFLAPLDGPDGKKNAWGKFVLMEPADSVAESSPGHLETAQLKPTSGGLFGAFILGARYTTAYPRDQFEVSAREHGFGSLRSVGQAYTFHVPIPPGP